MANSAIAASGDGASSGTILTIEEERLYLLPLGEKDGAQKDTIVEIFRGEEKLAEGRLISVAPQSSLCQIIELLVSKKIEATDEARLKNKAKPRSPKKEDSKKSSKTEMKAEKGSSAQEVEKMAAPADDEPVEETAPEAKPAAPDIKPEGQATSSPAQPEPKAKNP